MNPLLTANLRRFCVCLALFLNTAQAGQVSIVGADFRNIGDDRWAVDVTLRHADSGWDHYADEWRVVDSDGKVLGDRVLYHPHVNEQPFTRGLSAIIIPAAAHIAIEAHDKRHGWSPTRLEVDLGQAVNGRMTIEAR